MRILLLREFVTTPWGTRRVTRRSPSKIAFFLHLEIERRTCLLLQRLQHFGKTQMTVRIHVYINFFFDVYVWHVRWDDDVTAVVLSARAHRHWQTGRGLRGRGVRQQAQGLYLGGLHRGQVLRHDVQRILQVMTDNWTMYQSKTTF